MSLETKRFEFGDFTLDAKEKTLLRHGKPLQITPKSFQLLLILVERHGHLVEKTELMNEVWADRFVEEANLSFTIGLLRKALNDNAQKPRFIETVPKHGYRFIADVNRVGTAEENSKLASDDDLVRPSSGQTGPEAEVSQRVNGAEQQNPAGAPASRRNGSAGLKTAEKSGSSSEILHDAGGGSSAEKPSALDSFGKKRTIAGLTAVLFLAGLIALGIYYFSPESAPAAGKRSIVVLPLKPINAAHRDELYEIGIADSLIHRLGATKELIVRPLSAIRKYDTIEQDPIAAGREQQTDYVLASNYQLAGGKIRVTAQLFNIADGQIDETFKSEQDAGNVFAMQDAIAGEIGNLLLARFNAPAGNPAAKHGTANEEAYRLYLQGTYLYDKRNLPDAKKAIQSLEQAVRLDPNYAEAWAGKAYAHRVAGNFSRSVDVREEYRKSIEAINKALALNENLAEAHSALCDNKMYYEYDFEGAERECRRAVELNPGSSLAHNVYSRYLNSRGRFDEAISEIKTAIDLEPASFHNQRNLGVSLYFARRYDEAVRQFKRVIEMDKNHPSTYMWLLFALEMRNNEPENFEWFMKWLTVQKDTDKETIRTFQQAYQRAGWPGVLRERLAGLEKSTYAYFNGAAEYALIGEKDKAFEYLEKSFRQRELWMANLKVDPRLDSLRGDPRYNELVRRVESRDLHNTGSE